LGKTFKKIVTIGPVGYALSQVQDDRGSAVTPSQVGARDRAIVVRYAHDLAVETRPVGQLLLLGLTIGAWQPR
jgi:hypothetical protein